MTFNSIGEAVGLSLLIAIMLSLVVITIIIITDYIINRRRNQ